MSVRRRFTSLYLNIFPPLGPRQGTPHMQILKVATACFLNDSQELLVVRKKNTTAWMLPGGKLDADETSSEALIRELKEELQIEVAASTLQFIGAFHAIAANEVNTSVNAHVFVVRLPNDQTPINAAEIAEMKWLPLSKPIPTDIAPESAPNH